MLPSWNVEDLVEFFQSKGYEKDLARLKRDSLCGVF